MSKKIALFPGTFDPPTKGHLDIIRRAAHLWDEVIVGVAHVTPKTTLFTTEERLALVRQDIASLSHDVPNGPGSLRPLVMEGLLVDFAHAMGVTCVIRGLRAASDFDYEFQMAGMNRHLDPQLETVFMMASDTHQFVASRFIREIARLGGDTSAFVSAYVGMKLKDRLSNC